MNTERFIAWQAGLQTRDQGLCLLALLVACGVLVWLAWGRETETRRRLMLAGWWLLEAGLLTLGVVAQFGGMIP